MYQLGIARFSAVVATLGLAASLNALQAQAASQVVTVLYAGSLVTPMEGPVKSALRERGIEFQGQPGVDLSGTRSLGAGRHRTGRRRFLLPDRSDCAQLPFIPLPGNAALTNRIAYTLAVMKAAPHPDAARAFAAFILTGEGRKILETAGLNYLPQTH
ncbi:MAG: substrate-binding domain-containing protein [Candidatus Cybelea sp.]